MFLRDSRSLRKFPGRTSLGNGPYAIGTTCLNWRKLPIILTDLPEPLHLPSILAKLHVWEENSIKNNSDPSIDGSEKNNDKCILITPITYISVFFSFFIYCLSMRLGSACAAAEPDQEQCSWNIDVFIITKTRLLKYIENFTTKNWKFSDKISDIFHISAQTINCGYSARRF